jgi:integrase
MAVGVVTARSRVHNNRFRGTAVMSKADSNATAAPGKPQKPNKPRPDCPLYAHATKRWAAKIGGKTHFFGPWENPDAAEKKHHEQKAALKEGRKPREASAGVTVKELVNAFLATKQSLVDSGELTQRSWDDYKSACDLAIEKFGKSRLVADLDPDDFAKLRDVMVKKKWGPTTIGNVIQRIRVAFKFAYDNDKIDRPVRYGQNFSRPNRKSLRIHRAKKGPKLFTGEEVRTLINGVLVVGDDGPELIKAGKVMRAMVLLGINCGFGNADCGHLAHSHLDLVAGMVDYPRPKTGVERRCALWPETVAALREAIAIRPKPNDDMYADLVFITKYGLPWAKDTADQTLAKEFGKLLKTLDIKGRKGLGFYTLRHTFRTVADEAKDQPAADKIMGHEPPIMSSVYRETISDTRLKTVVEHVRKWVWPPEEKEEPKSQA